ncbi:MAG: type II toxin-antitoxin system VapC family toxin [Nitrososphaerota archaeon]|nr:type II toxin-antitoxin system VapC family toxin [Nitrososphaerota archaeon]MDG7023099.1 type II toxin-antitoxin system VapC family toxin [Nitrososphaerota archaeon]
MVEGLLNGQDEFASERFLAPDLIVHEVANTLFVQHRVLHTIPDGLPYVERLFRAIETGSLILVPVTEDLAVAAYKIASGNAAAVYDCVFIALALQREMQLKTRDRKQAEILELERRKRSAQKHPDDKARRE